MRKYIYFVALNLLCLLSLLVTSCENDSVVNGLSVESGSSVISSDLKIIHSLGFDTTNVVVTDSFYVVEGDIVFEKNKIQEYAKEEINTRQAQANSTVSFSNVKLIKLKIDDSLYSLSDWRSAILEAISEYNNIGSLIHFEEVSSNYDILIKEDSNLGDDVLGQGAWPSDGKVGNCVKINTFYNDLSLYQKVYLIVHELGHNLGLRHTNWNGNGESAGIGIIGTPNEGNDPDPSSVMNAATGRHFWSGFSYYDLVALRTLYPIYLTLNVSRLTANVNENVSYNIEGEVPINTTILWESTDMSLISGQNTKNAVFKTSGTKFKTVKATIHYNGNLIQLENSQLWIGVPYYVSSPDYVSVQYRDDLTETFHLTAIFSGYPTSYKWKVNGASLSSRYINGNDGEISILYKYLPVGNYTYTVTATNSCGESSVCSFYISIIEP